MYRLQLHIDHFFHDSMVCNTSYLMGIVRIKRVCHKIPSIGERTYTTLPKIAQYADFSFILTIFSMIPWLVLSCNAFNTSHLMHIVRLNRVYLKIPSIDERTYTILLETLQSVVQKFKTQCCFLSTIMGTNMYVRSSILGILR